MLTRNRSAAWPPSRRRPPRRLGPELGPRDLCGLESCVRAERRHLLLLDALFADRAALRASKTIVEIGPGSGVVATYLAKLTQNNVLAVDINEAACALTMRTADANGARVDVVRATSAARCGRIVLTRWSSTRPTFPLMMRRSAVMASRRPGRAVVTEGACSTGSAARVARPGAGGALLRVRRRERPGVDRFLFTRAGSDGETRAGRSPRAAFFLANGGALVGAAVRARLRLLLIYPRRRPGSSVVIRCLCVLARPALPRACRWLAPSARPRIALNGFSRKPVWPHRVIYPHVTDTVRKR